jgi:hypothetical protein
MRDLLDSGASLAVMSKSDFNVSSVVVHGENPTANQWGRKGGASNKNGSETTAKDAKRRNEKMPAGLRKRRANYYRGIPYQ